MLAQARDGYHLLLCTHFEAINTAIYKNALFKLSDLAPISLVTKYYYGLALANSIPADDFASFVRYAKARPGEVSYATIGAGSAQEILARQLEKLTGVTMNRIPFRGGPQVVQELVAGRVHFYVSPTLAIAPQYQAKQLKILAVSAPERLKNLSDIPTLAENGHRLRAVRLARHVRRGRHAAADHRSAAAAYRSDRRHAGIPHADRERRIDGCLVDPSGAAASDRADAGRRRGQHPRVRNAAGPMSSSPQPMSEGRKRRSRRQRTGGHCHELHDTTAISRCGSAGMLAAGLAAPRPAFALETIRQGYQTNIWGMPTYYLLKSGLLEKRGIKVEEFAVPSGNLTMQQMVARQVDMGTYAGPSFIIGHDKGGLVAIAHDRICRQDRADRDAARTSTSPRSSELKGRKVANQTGSSIGNLFVDVVARNAGLEKGDFQEVRMNVNDMVAAMAAKTVDAMVNVEPYNEIAVAEGIGTSLMDFSGIDRYRCSWRRRPISSTSTPTPSLPTSRRGRRWRATSRTIRARSPTSSTRSSPRRATPCRARPSPRRWRASRSIPAFPTDLMPGLQRDAEVLLREKKISAIPDWKKALRPDLWAKAKA